MIAVAFFLLAQDVLKPEDQPKKMLYRYLEAECRPLFEARRRDGQRPERSGQVSAGGPPKLWSARSVGERAAPTSSASRSTRRRAGSEEPASRATDPPIA